MDVGAIQCDFPEGSVLDLHTVRQAYYWDSYCVSLKQAGASMAEVFFAIFGHHPWWMKAVLIARHRVASWLGLAVPSVADVLSPAIKSSYRVGDTIGVWPIFHISADELLVGRDNHHLDFRLSVLRVHGGDTAQVVVSTLCTVHNWYGKLYLFFVIPFHKWGVQRLLWNAVNAARL